MPTRRGPGRPVDVGRPRKIQAEWEQLSEGFALPRTRMGFAYKLIEWEEFLRRRRVDSDAVTIHDVIAFEGELVQRGFTRNRGNTLSAVKSFYSLKARANPDSKWSRLAAELEARRPPKTIGRTQPWKPYPLQLLPKILDAARYVTQHDNGQREIYSEVYAVVGTLLYSGGRAQFYGLRVDQVEAALDHKFLEAFVKHGEFVQVPIHDCLLEIWKQHLDRRDFDGPQLFRYGRDAYTYQEGSKDWMEDAIAIGSNDGHVSRSLRGHASKSQDSVSRRLEEKYAIRERLTAHRFRKSVGTFMELYGYAEAERRLQLSHGARTITQSYSVPDILELQKKLSKLDLGSAEWVAAHDPPYNLFANGNGHADDDQVAELKRQLQEERERNHRLEDKLDQLLARSDPKVVA